MPLKRIAPCRWLTALAANESSARMMRFVLVGIAATLTYFCLGNLLAYTTAASALFNHLVASGVSICVSYLGHAYYTFGVSGRKAIVRFAITTAIMLTLTSALAEALDRLGAPAFLNVLIVTITYPVGSFLLHRFWTFR